MRTDIAGLSFGLTEPIVRHVRGQLAAALTPAPRPEGVRRVAVKLRDVNGPHGGVDKACRIVVSLHRRATIAVEAVDRDLYTAVTRSARKLREAVRRRVTRRRRVQRLRRARLASA
jgi:ribosome-associated translation inhibitor RaiA